MYIQLVLCQLFVGKKTSHEKGDLGDMDPNLDREPSGKSGVLSPTYSSLFSCPHTPCSSVPASPCLWWHPLHPSHCAWSQEHLCYPRDGDRDSVPQSSSISSCPRSNAAAHPIAGGQRGSSINEDFNDGYRLVLQASESHLNSGNFKLFWQYKRA